MLPLVFLLHGLITALKNIESLGELYLFQITDWILLVTSLSF